jgi:thiol-disulfide isomerase/thioredoxin
MLTRLARAAVLLLCCWVAAPVLAKSAPDPAYKTLDGQTRKLSTLRGKTVVVNFWATWCLPCQDELPRLSRLAAEYADKPVVFVFISIDEPKDRAKIPAALERLHLTQESWVGGNTDVMAAFGLGDIVPGTAVLDDHGQIVARVMGEAREEDLRTPLDWLLHDRSGAPPAAMTRRY